MARCCLITTAVIVALLALVVLKTVNDAGALRKLTVHGTEGCVQLKSVGDKDLGGLEDFASVHSGAHKGLVIGATDYRHDWLSGLLPLVPPFFSTLDLASLIATSAPGLIVTIDASQDAPTVNVLTIKEYPDKIFHPHGVSLLPPARTTSTNPVLLLVNHMPNGDRIERFEIDIAANTATWQGSFSDARWKILNDVVGVTDDAFYVTEWLTQLPGTVGLWWEIFAQRHWASVQYCTGASTGSVTCRVAASHLHMANGIEASADTSQLYVATHRELRVFDRDVATGDLVASHQVAGDIASLDNLALHAESGDVTGGAHPNALAFLFYSQAPRTPGHTAPSAVVRFPASALHLPPDSPARGTTLKGVTQRVLTAPGSLLPGSSAAVYTQGKYLVGAVYELGMVCADPATAEPAAAASARDEL